MKPQCKTLLTYLLISALPLSLLGCSEPEPEAPVIKKVKAIQIGELSNLEQRAFPGKAQAVEEANLSFRVSGQVEVMNVKSGDFVKKGDVLAILDETDLKNSVKVAEGLLAEATAAHLDASRNYKRAMDIQTSNSGVISQTAVDRAQANYEITKASQESAEASLAIAEDRLSYAKLKAPFDGEVVATYSEAHETIVAKQNILRLINRDSMEFVFDVPERLIGYSDLVEKASVRFDVRPDIAIPAEIKEVGREASKSTRTYPITLKIDQISQYEVLPGMAGKAHIQASMPMDSEFTGIDIPSTALFSKGEIENSYVWVIEQNQVKQRSVEVLSLTDSGVKVASGLNQGDWVVTAGVNFLVEDQRVSILETKAEE